MSTVTEKVALNSWQGPEKLLSSTTSRPVPGPKKSIVQRGLPPGKAIEA
jgi:hypothetical protein